MEIFQALLLGVIQGITEWLPVSSSGHLVITQQFLGLEVPVLFDVVLHLGTLFVILTVFRKEIYSVISALVRLDFRSQEGKMAGFVFLGNIPTGLFVLLFHSALVGFFSNLLVVGAALLGTGFVLNFSGWREGERELDTRSSLLVGLAQGIAVIPGVSRSGLTISAGLLAGVERETAVRYSFLLFIPAVVGAFLLELGDVSFLGRNLVPVLVGFFVSLGVGYISLKLLIKLVLRKKFHYFSYYCWTAGGLIVIYTLLQTI